MAKRLEAASPEVVRRAEPVQDRLEVVTAEFEGEQPARQLAGPVRPLIWAAAAAVSLYALYWVFDPRPSRSSTASSTWRPPSSRAATRA